MRLVYTLLPRPDQITAGTDARFQDSALTFLQLSHLGECFGKTYCTEGVDLQET